MTREVWISLNLEWVRDLTTRHESMSRCPPVGSVVKLNSNTAFDESQAKSISRVVARNVLGEVLAFKTVVHREVASSFATEALMCLQEMFRGKQMGFTSVLAREAMREESRAYLIRRVPKQGTSKVDLWRRREPD
ncbi:hypothetical protein Gotur_000339 [Gossypium turneri]